MRSSVSGAAPTDERMDGWAAIHTADSPFTFERILITIDDDPGAVHAAHVDVALARLLAAEMALIHVVDPSLTAIPEAGIPAGALIAQAEYDGKRLMAEFRRQFSDCFALEFLRLGSPAAEIIEASTLWPADLIVIGSHGRGGFSRVVLGSVSDAVIRHAPYPVLVVRARD
jgi:nucleotide-binding universal stress UspA family protein